MLACQAVPQFTLTPACHGPAEEGACCSAERGSGHGISLTAFSKSAGQAMAAGLGSGSLEMDSTMWSTKVRILSGTYLRLT